MANQSMNKLREKFEQLYLLKYNGRDPCFQIAESGGNYVYQDVQEKWEYYQAAYAQAISEFEQVAQVLMHEEQSKIIPNDTFVGIVPYGLINPPQGTPLYTRKD